MDVPSAAMTSSYVCPHEPRHMVHTHEEDDPPGPDRFDCDPECDPTPKDWPFTPEVDSGGWMVGWDHGRPGFVYFLDSDHHPGETEAQRAANVNLIAAAPRMYRALKAVIDANRALVEATMAEEELGAIEKLDQAVAVEAQNVIDWIEEGAR